MSEPALRRIIVAVDGSPQSLQALEAAAGLAASLEAELHGLFVEDSALLQLASLPFAREVRTYTATVRQINPEIVQGQLRRQSLQARRAIESVAVRARVAWAFRVRRGPVVGELLDEMSEADLVVLGRGRHLGQRRLGSTARAILLETTRPVLMIDKRLPPSPHALVLFDGSERAERTLALTSEIVDALDGYLTLACAAGSPGTALIAQRQGFTRLRAQGREAQCRWLIKPTVHKLATVFQAERADLLAVPGDIGLLGGENLAHLLQHISGPVLVVR
ncbi:MAG TPA: universal stress protein [Aggregatilineales bacterium]|nr:universal stress protein [Aggregatilineales bacterium]